MSDKTVNMAIFDMADEFIAVANRLLEEEHKDLGQISAAIRYAAAANFFWRAYIRIMKRLAPTEKFSPWLPSTSPA